MPIASTDIDYHLSGGGTNTDPNASLGGIISSTQIVDASLNNLFDDVSGTESANGDTEYRCMYVKNAHATLTLQNARVYIASDSTSADTSIEIALDGAGVGDGSTTGVAETVANESTAPTGETFSAPTSGAPLSIGDIGPGQCQAIWVKRIVAAGAAALATDATTITVTGETAE